MSNKSYVKLIAYDRWLLNRYTLFCNENIDTVESCRIDKFIATQPRSVVALIINSDKQILTVSRRNQPNNLGLPGGKIDPGETPEQALVRELLEETGVEAKDFNLCFERIDQTDKCVVWCYRVTTWKGIPRQREPGIHVSWVEPSLLIDKNCTFSEYNSNLFASLKIMSNHA